MVVLNELLAMGPTIFELWIMKTEIWVMEINEPNNLLIFVTRHSSLITPHLKYLNFLIPPV